MGLAARPEKQYKLAYSVQLAQSSPVVLLRNMVATKSFHGSLYSCSWTRLKGEVGGWKPGYNKCLCLLAPLDPVFSEVEGIAISTEVDGIEEDSVVVFPEVEGVVVST